MSCDLRPGWEMLVSSPGQVNEIYSIQKKKKEKKKILAYLVDRFSKLRMAYRDWFVFPFSDCGAKTVTTWLPNLLVCFNYLKVEFQDFQNSAPNIRTRFLTNPSRLSGALKTFFCVACLRIGKLHWKCSLLFKAKEEEDLSKEELLRVKETLSTERDNLHKIKGDREEYIGVSVTANLQEC